MVSLRSAAVRLVVGIGLCLVVACSSGSEHAKRRPGSTASTAPSTAPSATTTASGAQWTTYYRDAQRSGVAPDGPTTPAALRKQWTSPNLDGDVYAQPLLVGGSVVVATANDTVYALNASDGQIAWKTHLGDPVPGSSLPCGNVDPVGITSTPVVDPSAGRVYAVGMVQPGRHVLFELDLSSGRLVASQRVDVDGADPSVHNQRAALTLTGGKVFIAYGGRFGDCGDYRGRVVSVSVSAAGLGTMASYTLPARREGGFWSPPGPVVGPDGSLYLTSGNSESRGSYDYGNSVLRISPDLMLVDSFAPSEWASLNASDTDLGSTSPVLLPGGRVFQVGKSGVGYLLDGQHLGGIGAPLHSERVCSSSAFGGVAHDGDTLFVPCSDSIVQVTVSGDRFSTGWSASASTPGPTIVAGGAVWSVATGDNALVALDPASGRTLSSQSIDNVPSRFTSPAAGAGRVVIGDGHVVLSFGP